MKELSNDYMISVDVMISMAQEESKGNFKLVESEFFSMETESFKKCNILREDGSPTKQIFKMDDGKFILEVDDCGEVEYFYSNNLNDLV